MPPYTSTQAAWLLRGTTRRPLSPRGHTALDKPHTGPLSIPQMCQSNYRPMLLSMERGTLGYNDACTLARLHVFAFIIKHTHTATHKRAPLELWTLLFSRGFRQLKATRRVELVDWKPADPSLSDIFSKRVGACKPHKIHCMCMCVCVFACNHVKELCTQSCHSAGLTEARLVLSLPTEARWANVRQNQWE